MKGMNGITDAHIFVHSPYNVCIGYSIHTLHETTKINIQFLSKCIWYWQNLCKDIYKLFFTWGAGRYLSAGGGGGGGAGQFFGKPVISSATPPPPAKFLFRSRPPQQQTVCNADPPPQWPLPIAKPKSHYTRNSKWLSKCY